MYAIQTIIADFLQDYPTEVEAFQCKVVCLINLEKFQDALSAINKEKALHSHVRFEKAYCEYRLNRTEEAVSTLRAGGDNLDNRCKELLAQVLYRLEEYQECYDLYRDLIKNSEDEFDEERQTNLAAVLASLQLWNAQNVEAPAFSEGTYELCYNQACYLIGQGEYKAAEQKLRQAEAMCKESLSDDGDIPEEELDEELAIIRVQLGYLLQQQGRVAEANVLYNTVMKSKPSDVGLMAVLSNNLVAINKDQNVFDSKKKMKVATGSNLKHKLSAIQRRDIDINQCLLYMYTNQADQCHQLAKQLQKQFPDIETPVLIEAAQFARDKQLTEAIDLLTAYTGSRKADLISLPLAVCQLHLQMGSICKACDALKTLGEFQYKPGVVSTLVTLYMSQEDTEGAMQVLARAVDWTRKNQPQSDALQTLLRVNTSFMLKYRDPKSAIQLLEELRKKNPKDPKVLAQLISAYSKIDPGKAQQVSRDLPSVEETAASVDVEALEAAFSSLGPKYMKKAQKTEPSPGPAGDQATLLQKKNKKKKKTKLPKNYNPDVTPDPERWLPRRERSYYRGKRKDKKKDIGKGSQGATTANMDALDASKTPQGGSDPNSPRPGTATTPQGPRQSKPAQAQKKKKKKGGKGR
ncbi:signal recognition particle subunit SRP72-like isoform X2 [Dreissena polymorpha]|uniref:signal recognition particle subunit SRP72-like isoform X2 n=1 Tax=Dreissena polymorpha TaxID=45954 RepID=UPI002264012A|nr:signal recognition particle subunit SRP72-like isoform X2 [Dreissena polymorpha]